MGMWIAIIIVLFVLGSMMTLKPSGIDQRVDKLRMAARRLQLNPKLVPCPEWVRGRDNEYGRGMLGQYGLVLDNAKMPHNRYQVVSGHWRPDSSVVDAPSDSVALTIPSTIHSHNRTFNKASTTPDKGKAVAKSRFYLDQTPLALPSTIEPFVKALVIQSNSIIIYWEDIAYVRATTNPTYHASAIEPDLSALKSQLEQWAATVQTQSAQKAHEPSLLINA